MTRWSTPNGGDDQFGLSARFALSARLDDEREEVPGDIETVETIRGTTGEVVEQITAPNSDGECPHCGLALPETGPPMCPRCGGPY